jgi:hypothetical protein
VPPFLLLGAQGSPLLEAEGRAAGACRLRLQPGAQDRGVGSSILPWATTPFPNQDSWRRERAQRLGRVERMRTYQELCFYFLCSRIYFFFFFSLFNFRFSF